MMFNALFSDDTCRLCAAQVDNHQPIFIDPECMQLSSIGHMMQDCLFADVRIQSDYPAVVCQFCHLQLNIFYEFKKKVLEHHQIFTEMLAARSAQHIDCPKQSPEKPPPLSPTHNFTEEHYLWDEADIDAPVASIIKDECDTQFDLSDNLQQNDVEISNDDELLLHQQHEYVVEFLESETETEAEPQMQSLVPVKRNEDISSDADEIAEADNEDDENEDDAQFEMMEEYIDDDDDEINPLAAEVDLNQPGTSASQFRTDRRLNLCLKRGDKFVDNFECPVCQEIFKAWLPLKTHIQ